VFLVKIASLQGQGSLASASPRRMAPMARVPSQLLFFSARAASSFFHRRVWMYFFFFFFSLFFGGVFSSRISEDVDRVDPPLYGSGKVGGPTRRCGTLSR